MNIKMNLEWNVFYYDFNAKEIKVSNVFNHSRYRKDIEDLLHKCTDMEEFSDKLRSVTMYYFWSKCEWETVIHPWVGNSKAAKKIDVFWQLKNNWDRFVEYVWNMSLNKRCRKHGHWTYLSECANEGIYCSVCNKKVYKKEYANQKIKSKYCPNCGAIMDEIFEVL